MIFENDPATHALKILIALFLLIALGRSPSQ